MVEMVIDQLQDEKVWPQRSRDQLYQQMFLVIEDQLMPSHTLLGTKYKEKIETRNSTIVV